MDYLLICHNDTKFENIQYFSQNACQLRIFSIVLDSKEFQCHCKSLNIGKSVKICIKWALYCSDTKFSNFIINEQIPLDFLGKVLQICHNDIVKCVVVTLCHCDNVSLWQCVIVTMCHCDNVSLWQRVIVTTYYITRRNRNASTRTFLVYLI